MSIYTNGKIGPHYYTFPVTIVYTFKLEGEVIVQENGEIFLRLLKYKKKDSKGYLINARRMKEQRAAWLLYILSEYGYIPKPTITITDYNSLNKDL